MYRRTRHNLTDPMPNLTDPMPDLPITAVSTRAFCPRQAYLQHAEQARSDNRYTVEGRALHAALPTDLTHNVHLAHETLGLVGVADAVAPGPIPIEHKRGEATNQRPQHIQLALYALCLEEMLSVPVPFGVIVHGLTHQREEIAIHAGLRAEALAELHALREELSRDQPPPPRHLPHCQSCSLNHIGLPTLPAGSARAHLDLLLQEP